MKSEVGWRVAHHVLIIFGVMPSIKGPESASEFSMNVADLVGFFGFAHNQNRRF